MSWIQKLCDVYDNVIETSAADGDCALLPVGFLRKPIKYNIILSPQGEFVTAQVIPDAEQICPIPSTPAAESRVGENGTPFPLADQLKYLLCEDGVENPRFENYLQQLADWCAEPDAPACLHVLHGYLAQRTLYADLLGTPGLKLKYHKDENAHDAKGADAKAIACFSIQSASEENRLWMRADVRESWTRRLAASGGQRALCYATGTWLPVMQSHPKLSGNAKLISAKDVGFPFQYRGRFTEERSAATVSVYASAKAHNALRWLLSHQGFSRYGMSVICWNTAAPVLDTNALFSDEADPGREKPLPDTFEGYARALRDAVLSNYTRLHNYADPDALTEEALQRMEQVVILGMEAATDGRMSIIYYQEIPGNVYQARLDAWDRACRWEMPGARREVRPPEWREICEAVMGRDAVQTARKDFKCDKAATKLMRENQLLLIGCTAGGRTLPRSFPEQAFHRAVQPLRFTDGSGRWKPFAWMQCVATACALTRKHRIDRGLSEISHVLDPACCARDYLYGRLFAVAHALECAARDDRSAQTCAVRCMARFVQRPGETWQQLYLQLLPYLKRLGKSGHKARDYQRLLGQIEQQFDKEDRLSARPLSDLFLAGFSSQLRELYLPAAERQPLPVARPYTPPTTRDALFGCLLAVADDCEWNAERSLIDGKLLSGRDGRTNAMLHTAAFAAAPAETWQRVHDRLIPYLDRSGVDTADYVQRLLRRIEQGFDPAERLMPAPLGSGFLHGYLCMRCALMTRGGLETAAWKPVHRDFAAACRDDAFGALLALENRIERWALDREKPDAQNRPSNAMRFLTHAAQRPDEVCAYLEARVYPYRKKLGFPRWITAEYQALHAGIDEHDWQTSAPLGAGYLYAFYLYEPNTHGRISDGKEG